MRVTRIFALPAGANLYRAALPSAPLLWSAPLRLTLRRPARPHMQAQQLGRPREGKFSGPRSGSRPAGRPLVRPAGARKCRAPRVASCAAGSIGTLIFLSLAPILAAPLASSSMAGSLARVRQLLARAWQLDLWPPLPRAPLRQPAPCGPCVCVCVCQSASSHRATRLMEEDASAHTRICPGRARARQETGRDCRKFRFAPFGPHQSENGSAVAATTPATSRRQAERGGGRGAATAATAADGRKAARGPLDKQRLRGAI